MATAVPEAARRRERRQMWVGRGVLALILIGAFLARIRDARHVLDGERVFLPGYDTYYHMRRIQHAVASWPVVPAFDAWVNAPEGADIYWPAGFDLALATVARLSGARPWSSEVERCCAWAVPVLGVGVVAAAYWLGLVWRGRSTGLVAALIVAAVPMSISVSAVGRVDHDVAVILCAALAFGCSLAALGAAGGARGLIWAVLGGALLAANLWVWPGAIVFLLVAAAFFAVRSLADDSVSDVALATTGSAALVATVLCIVSASARPGELSHVFLSGLHIILAWTGAASQIVLAIVFRSAPRGRRVRLALGMLSQLVVAVAAALSLAGAFRGVGSFLSAEADTVVATAGEASGLFARGVGGVGADLSWLALALPPAAALVLMRAFGHRRRPGDWLVVLWLAAFVALAVAQRRFAAALAVPAALCIAQLAVLAFRRTASVPPLGRWLLRIGLAASAGYALAMPTQRWRARPYAPNWEFRAVAPALDWLRDEAPSAGDARSFGAKPAYSVAAFWHYGHWLTYVAEQANVACPFGNAEQHQRGLERAHALFGARTEAEAAELCSRLGIRYVLSPELPLPLMVNQAGLDARRPGEQKVMATSLHVWRGLRAPDHAGPLRHFRLVGEFEGTWPGGRRYTTRLFEHVPGALVAGRAPGSGEVRFRLDLADASGRTLRYEADTRPDETGAFQLRVPYATGGAPSLFRATGPAQLTWRDGRGEQSVEITIPEAVVQSGATVRRDLE